jgi:3-oxoacyl-[acyl-carrier protein] reductase
MSKEKPGVWITGASSGIGRAAAIEFAKTGAKVFASGRRAAELERINIELDSDKISVVVFPCNVASHANVDQTVKKILANGKIDCLINNAGITSFKLAEDNSVNEINDIIQTNLLGSIYAIKAVLPQMISNGGGTIINILSVVTKKTFTKSSIYAASKMGLLGYTNSLREEVRKHNIKVINVIPGATATPIWSKEIRNQFSNRMMTAEDIARVLVWAFLQKENLVTEELILRPIEGDL